MTTSNERLKHKIKCLENHIEHFENIPSEYKYIWDKKWEDMTYEEQGIYYRAIPAAKLTPCDGVTTKEYLIKYAVLDGMGNMDGFFVPLSVAMIAIQKALDHEIEHRPPSRIKKDEDNNECGPESEKRKNKCYECGLFWINEELASDCCDE